LAIGCPSGVSLTRTRSRDGYRFAKHEGESIFTTFKNPYKMPVSRILLSEPGKAVQIRFIAILKLPFKFYRSYASNKPANGERVFRKSGNLILRNTRHSK
jgi:hypothetical protein